MCDHKYTLQMITRKIHGVKSDEKKTKQTKVSFYNAGSILQETSDFCLNNISIHNQEDDVKKNAILFKLFWYKVFVHRKLKLLNFLMDFISSPPKQGR